MSRGTPDVQDVAVIGAGGFSGREILRILARHPYLRPVHATSDQFAGEPLSRAFPDLEGAFREPELRFSAHAEELPAGIPVFLATPNDTSMKLVPEYFNQGRRVVDLSGSFRLHDREKFQEYYNLQHDSFGMMENVVFGLPEMFRGELKNARLVANPGCYPTSVIAPLFFLGDLRSGLAGIVIDAKSGVSGAGGRVVGGGFPFTEVYEDFRAYKVLKHQHQPEIEEYISFGMAEPMEVVFTTHLLPLFRGILSTCVLTWREDPPGDLKERLSRAAEAEPFVRFLPEPEDVRLSRVQNTNFLDFSCRTRGRQTVLVAALDNLLKGAAGQAVQNMNLMLGLPETAGLLPDPSYSFAS